VLQLLAGVVQDIIALVAYFKIMNSVIAHLVEDHERRLQSVATQQEGGEALSDADLEVWSGPRHLVITTD
jgi:hypothetical protein